MRFSDLMGSGAEREPKHRDASETDNTIVDAIAPYLDDRSDTAPPPPVDTVVEPVEVVAAAEPWAPPAPDLPAPPAPTPAPAPAPAPAVASFDVAADPTPPRRAWQPERPVMTPLVSAAPVDVSAPTSTTATAIADFTPLSDDLLPRRR